MYLAAVVLPFASGTGAAAKGLALDFVPVEERSDALSGIALIENIGGSPCSFPPTPLSLP